MPSDLMFMCFVQLQKNIYLPTLRCSCLCTVRSKILSILIFATCVILRSRISLGVCLCQRYRLGRRLPVELQCSLHQGQQGDVNQCAVTITKKQLKKRF